MKRQKIKETRRPHLWIHCLVFDDIRLRSSDFSVYGTLTRFINNETQKCFPSLDTIATRSHLSKRTVIRSLIRLEKFNYISIEKSGGGVNVYILLEPEQNKFNTSDKMSP